MAANRTAHPIAARADVASAAENKVRTSVLAKTVTSKQGVKTEKVSLDSAPAPCGPMRLTRPMM